MTSIRETRTKEISIDTFTQSINTEKYFLVSISLAIHIKKNAIAVEIEAA
ncbi:protein of unknown function [Mesotoga infera]|uniref:Uncharacterized protein n=1 Tax=Mesotoga infera TaxID=1236046 RepID=A0A7Z7PPQ4_9BACT|nr:protein of unknown function [Mesotoga infera]